MYVMDQVINWAVYIMPGHYEKCPICECTLIIIIQIIKSTGHYTYGLSPFGQSNTNITAKVINLNILRPQSTSELELLRCPQLQP
ncbi:unnamed protein product [Chrysodeixis includens]|uniref:Uncharacterized protein n=1 Tax=Chrysodeixis includens TaxID=689277 RepID=A0A9N8PZW3_CHRIL|nr:unnamed protein product [Chrysodeixis includens]